MCDHALTGPFTLSENHLAFLQINRVERAAERELNLSP